jgi:hypothetical protein
MARSCISATPCRPRNPGPDVPNPNFMSKNRPRPQRGAGSWHGPSNTPNIYTCPEMAGAIFAFLQLGGFPRRAGFPLSRHPVHRLVRHSLGAGGQPPVLASERRTRIARSFNCGNRQPMIQAPPGRPKIHSSTDPSLLLFLLLDAPPRFTRRMQNAR